MQFFKIECSMTKIGKPIINQFLILLSQIKRSMEEAIVIILFTRPHQLCSNFYSV